MPQIVKVRTQPGPLRPHPHIAAVQLANGTTLSRENVVANIRIFGSEYWTQGGGLRAKVVVRGCPVCSGANYLTTLPDRTTKNNLLDLPKF